MVMQKVMRCRFSIMHGQSGFVLSLKPCQNMKSHRGLKPKIILIKNLFLIDPQYW